jgi:UDP-2,3-diacylglucosamine pyrophosphatase LpxH
LAIENNYHYVICGHIHQPQISRKVNKNGTCLYLNSGDWIENLTALEFHDNRWKLFHYSDFEKNEIKTNHENAMNFISAPNVFVNK